MASFSYISSSSYLALAVNTYLYPMYLIIPHFTVYPALTAAYVSRYPKKTEYAVFCYLQMSEIINWFVEKVLGSIVGLIHGYETYKAYRYFKGYR